MLKGKLGNLFQNLSTDKQNEVMSEIEENGGSIKSLEGIIKNMSYFEKLQ